MFSHFLSENRCPLFREMLQPSVYPRQRGVAAHLVDMSAQRLCCARAVWTIHKQAGCVVGRRLAIGSGDASERNRGEAAANPFAERPHPRIALGEHNADQYRGTRAAFPEDDAERAGL